MLANFGTCRQICKQMKRYFLLAALLFNFAFSQTSYYDESKFISSVTATQEYLIIKLNKPYSSLRIEVWTNSTPIRTFGVRFDGGKVQYIFFPTTTLEHNVKYYFWVHQSPLSAIPQKLHSAIFTFTIICN